MTDETVIEAEQDVTDQPQVEPGAEGPAETQEGEQEAQPTAVITLDGVELTPPADDADETPTFRELRALAKERGRQLRLLEEENRRLKAPAQPQNAEQELPPRPTLEDFGFDGDAHADAVEAWVEKKNAAEAKKREAKAAQDAQDEAWARARNEYEAKKAALPVPDAEEAEAEVRSAMSPVQQSILVKAPRSAELVYALGKQPAERARLAAIKDPVDFAYAAAEIMTKVNMTTKPSIPKPDRVPQSNAAGASSTDDVLDKLRAEAQKTGNMDKVLAYRAEQKKKL